MNDEVTLPDFEARVRDDDHQALKLWLRLLSCTYRVEGALRQRLRSTFGTTLARFDLLAQLDRHPQGLSMGELSQRLMVTGGNVTGLTDQLEREGLVQRTPHPSDRRSWTVKLTAAGRRHFRRMAAEHEAWVIELFAGWTPAEKSQMQMLLATLKQHLATNEASAAPARPARRSTSASRPGRAAPKETSA